MFSCLVLTDGLVWQRDWTERVPKYRRVPTTSIYHEKGGEHMKKRRLAAMALAAVMLTGCGGGGGGETTTQAAGGGDGAVPAQTEAAGAASGEAVTITLVESLTSPERTAVIREIADKYQADHPNVTIEIISPPLENADSKITQMLMNGSGADIVEVRDSTITQYATNGWIADLQQYIDAWDEKDTLTESADEVIHYFQDTAYMMPDRKSVV